MAAIAVPAKCGEIYVNVLMDEEDIERLASRKLSIGSHGYAQIWIRPKMMLLHRWIMNVPSGTRYRVIVDHINRDKLDCRRSNLRIISPSDSNLNREIQQRDLPIGVYLARSGRYEATLWRRRVKHHLGTHDTAEQAAAAVEAARQELDRDAFNPPRIAA